MKLIRHFLCLLIFLACALDGSSASLRVEQENDFYTISGVIKDKRTRKLLEYVNISIPGSTVGTVSNTEGAFSLKIKHDIDAKQLVFSHIGYRTQTLALQGTDLRDETFYLVRLPNVLEEIVVRSQEPRHLIEDAIRKIGDNYSNEDLRFTGFYRETVKKRSRYIDILEAIVHLNKGSYEDRYGHDRVEIHKGRRIISKRKGDTLAIKLAGGPTQSIHLDFVKNREIMLNAKELSLYEFRYEEPVNINNRPQYVVSFKPTGITHYALYYGTFYIDRETLTFTRAEFRVDMRDKQKATRFILLKKPFGLYFKPIEITFLVTFKQDQGRSYLSYIHNEMRFKCEWKKRWFSATYTVSSEVVMTDRQSNPANIPYKASFKNSQTLSDKVGAFSDPNFWEDYNILEPTQSLEKAVGKLRK